MTRALPFFVLGLFLVVAAAPTAAAGQTEPSRPTFRAGVDMVPVAAVVRDEHGRTVGGLRADDFVVVDGGERRPVLGFSEDPEAPISLAVLVDESGSMSGDRARVRGFVSALVAELGRWAVPGDRVALAGFSSSVREIVPFTTDFGRLRSGLERTEAFGATAVHDAIAAAARRLVPVEGRRALVVVTDGMDTRSRLTIEQVSGIAGAIDVPVYVARVERAPGVRPEARASLEDLARWTGGSAIDAASAGAAGAAASRIVSDVRHQYLIAFESAPQPGWRLLEIQTTQPGLTVRARSAYVAGSGGGRLGGPGL